MISASYPSSGLMKARPASPATARAVASASARPRSGPVTLAEPTRVTERAEYGSIRWPPRS
jgi:hypothetical protein